MHGILVTANIATGQFEAARRGLDEQVVPRFLEDARVVLPALLPATHQQPAHRAGASIEKRALAGLW